MACNKGSEDPPTKVGTAYKGGVILDQEVPKVDGGRPPPIVCTCTAQYTKRDHWYPGGHIVVDQTNGEVSRSSIVTTHVFTAWFYLIFRFAFLPVVTSWPIRYMIIIGCG